MTWIIVRDFSVASVNLKVLSKCVADYILRSYFFFFFFFFIREKKTWPFL